MYVKQITILHKYYLGASVELIQTQLPGLTGILDVYRSCHACRFPQSLLIQEERDMAHYSLIQYTSVQMFLVFSFFSFVIIL